MIIKNKNNKLIALESLIQQEVAVKGKSPNLDNLLSKVGEQYNNLFSLLESKMKSTKGSNKDKTYSLLSQLALKFDVFQSPLLSLLLEERTEYLTDLFKCNSLSVFMDKQIPSLQSHYNEIIENDEDMDENSVKISNVFEAIALSKVKQIYQFVSNTSLNLPNGWSYNRGWHDREYNDESMSFPLVFEMKTRYNTISTEDWEGGHARNKSLDNLYEYVFLTINQEDASESAVCFKNSIEEEFSELENVRFEGRNGTRIVCEMNVNFSYLEDDFSKIMNDSCDYIQKISVQYESFVKGIVQNLEKQRKLFDETFTEVFNKYPLVFDEISSSDIYEVFTERNYNTHKRDIFDILTTEFDYLMEEYYPEVYENVE